MDDGTIPAGDLSYGINQLLEADWSGISQIVNFIQAFFTPLQKHVYRSHHTLDDIPHIGVIPRHASVPEKSDGLVFQMGAKKLVYGQVRPLGRAVNGEKAKAVNAESVQLAINPKKQFSGALGDGVGADHGIQRSRLHKRGRRPFPIDRGGGAENHF